MDLEERLYGIVDWEGNGIDNYLLRKEKASKAIFDYNEKNNHKKYTLGISLGMVCILKREKHLFVNSTGDTKEIYDQNCIEKFNFDDVEKAVAVADRYNNLAAFE